MTKMVYCARPIDQVGVGTSDWSNLTNLGAKSFTPKEWVLYQPWHAFKVGSEAAPTKGLRQINDAAVAVCDATFAVLPAGVATYGTVAEIELAALGLGKPVALVTDLRPSWSLPETVEVFNMNQAGVEGAVSWLEDAMADKVVKSIQTGLVTQGNLQMPSGRTP